MNYFDSSFSVMRSGEQSAISLPKVCVIHYLVGAAQQSPVRAHICAKSPTNLLLAFEMHLPFALGTIASSSPFPLSREIMQRILRANVPFAVPMSTFIASLRETVITHFMMPRFMN